MLCAKSVKCAFLDRVGYFLRLRLTKRTCLRLVFARLRLVLFHTRYTVQEEPLYILGI